MKKIDILEKEYGEIYLMEDTTIIRALVCIVAAAFTPGDPIWLMIVGGSGGGKSEMIQMVNGTRWVQPVSMMTPNTLLSGAKKAKDGKDPSLLNRIGTNGVMTMKDFTTIISMREDARREILAQLRETYDGKITKETGTGASLQWKGKLNFLAGVTYSYYDKAKEIDSMGPRFILYELPRLDDKADRISFLDKSNDNMNDIEQKRNKLKGIATQAVEEIVDNIPDVMPKLDERINKNLKELAEFTARTRTPVSRDFKGTITLVHAFEMPARLYSQVYRTGQMFMISGDGDSMTKNEERLLYKFLLDSIPYQKRIILYELFKYAKASRKAIAHKLNLPTETVKNWVEDLNSHGILTRTTFGNTDYFSVGVDDKDLLSRVLDIETTNQTLDINNDGGFMLSDNSSYVKPAMGNIEIDEDTDPEIKERYEREQAKENKEQEEIWGF